VKSLDNGIHSFPKMISTVVSAQRWTERVKVNELCMVNTDVLIVADIFGRLCHLGGVMNVGQDN